MKLEKKEFSDKKRKELADKGHAMPDGSYPIENTSDLHNAIQSIGRAKDYDKTKRHIISRARALGATKMLPEEWKIKKFLDEVREVFEKAIGTTSSVNQEADERSVENYVRQSANTNINNQMGGNPIVSNTTEPDPKGDIAITKSIPDGTKGPLIGQETRPTDGATSVSDAPNGDSAVVPGNATFESSATSAITPTRTNEMQVPDKVSVQKSTTCPDCGASMMHECMSKADDSAEMEKAEVCSDCGKNPCECEKKSEDGNDKEPDADEDDVEKLKKEINRLNEELESLKKSEIQIENTHEQITKSVWGGAFSPIK